MLVFDVAAFSMSSTTRDFDPRTRAFSDEELKPQPMIKKSRKQFVPDDMKDDKYWARRRKNNMAAKRSRDARRMKENQIALRANYLEKEVVVFILWAIKTLPGAKCCACGCVSRGLWTTCVNIRGSWVTTWLLQ